MIINLKKSGFTVVEVLVAMVVLLLAVMSGFQLLTSFITTVSNNRDTLTATYLAQECLENARNQRDTNWKNFNPWFEKIDTIETANGSFNKFTINRTADFQIEEITINTENDAIETINEKTSATVTCTVKWNNKELSMESVLTNWKK